MRHLAIFDLAAIKLIFEGRRTIEGRFSQIKIPPFAKVAAGDEVLMKLSGEKIVGQFKVSRVLYFDHPKASELASLIKKHKVQLALTKTFWLSHERVNYATFIFIASVTKFIIPPQIEKHDLRPWVVLDDR